MNDVDKQIALEMTNTGKIDVEYTWSLEEREAPQAQVTAQGMQDPGTGSGAMVPVNERRPINEVFDILPIRGIIPPGTKIYSTITIIYVIPNN